ncbi:superoxide dismutase [Puccinia sorghi]|uniref:Superoxide dismutase n=1 Tax=Puccinia sorghi TaxID=27349 RepID=A0A0L6UDT8_9BASI|nr:superoxide dismutase [Puccinia sorghi]
MFSLGSRLAAVQMALLAMSAFASPQAAPAMANSASATFSGNGIEASFKFNSFHNGPGAHVEVMINGLYSMSFDYPYHIHVNPVRQGQSCELAGGHFNPTNAPMTPCNRNEPNTCEVGDLAGKFGNLPGSPQGLTRRSYYDPSLNLSQGADGILYRSIVIHGANNVRLACVNVPPAPSGTTRCCLPKLVMVVTSSHVRDMCIQRSSQLGSRDASNISLLADFFSRSDARQVGIVQPASVPTCDVRDDKEERDNTKANRRPPWGPPAKHVFHLPAPARKSSATARQGR